MTSTFVVIVLLGLLVAIVVALIVSPEFRDALLGGDGEVVFGFLSVRGAAFVLIAGLLIGAMLFLLNDSPPPAQPPPEDDHIVTISYAGTLTAVHLNPVGSDAEMRIEVTANATLDGISLPIPNADGGVVATCDDNPSPRCLIALEFAVPEEKADRISVALSIAGFNPRTATHPRIAGPVFRLTRQSASWMASPVGQFTSGRRTIFKEPDGRGGTTDYIGVSLETHQ